MQLPRDVQTPALLVDVPALRANVAAWAERAARANVALRPHAKTHKSPDIARLQLAAGAAGLTVATLSEARVFADAGVTDIFQAYPLWAVGGKARAVRELHERVAFTVGVDSAEGAVSLGRATRGCSRPLGVLVEVDSGQHRSGVAPGGAGAVARAAADAGLEVRGVFTHGGHVYRTADPRDAARDEAAAGTAAADALRAAGFDVTAVSVGSTPTAAYPSPGVTEVRPGVYVFGDAQQVHLQTMAPGDVALQVAATVVSRRGDSVVLDAGSKALGVDRPPWLEGYGMLVGHRDAVIGQLSEHHAVAHVPGGLPVGAVVAVVPNHACVAVNLFDEYLAVDADGSVTRWPVAARGCNT